jgi:1,2-diacylglycerol 3-beta-galactosyltransferase
MNPHKPHIVFLMSDTGGGHRAAARAIEAALQIKHPDAFTTELVDMWKDYTPAPLNKMPTIYTQWVNTHPASYGLQFQVNDRLFQSAAFGRWYAERTFGQIKSFYSDHPADIYVDVHPVFVHPAVYALRKLGLKQPFITVVTDYAWPVSLWYDPLVDRCLVPLEPAYERGLTLGLTPGQIILTGPVIHPRFVNLTMSKAEARTQLGWEQDARITLLVGGGDGMGPVVETAQYIDNSVYAGQLMVVAGRNEALKAQLDAIQWRHKVQIYGFVDNMEVFLRAADVLITKAGPATITEAAAVGIPMILNGAIEHQETVNATYVVEQKAGLYVTDPARVASELTDITFNAERLRELTEGVQRLAHPTAIWNIADEIWQYVDRK